MTKPDPAIITLVQQIDQTGYDLDLSPSPVDMAIEQVIDHYVALPPDQRNAILQAFGPHHSFTLLIFAMRMAMLAVRERSAYRVTRGLLALVIENARFDSREDLIMLSLLNHSAEKIEADPAALFEQAALVATPSMARALRDFAQRPAGLKRIESMGFREVDGSDGFRYERIG
jgi:hypothetical protein